MAKNATILDFSAAYDSTLMVSKGGCVIPRNLQKDDVITFGSAKWTTFEVANMDGKEAIVDNKIRKGSYIIDPKATITPKGARKPQSWTANGLYKEFSVAMLTNRCYSDDVRTTVLDRQNTGHESRGIFDGCQNATEFFLEQLKGCSKESQSFMRLVYGENVMNDLARCVALKDYAKDEALSIKVIKVVDGNLCHKNPTSGKLYFTRTRMYIFEPVK